MTKLIIFSYIGHSKIQVSIYNSSYTHQFLTFVSGFCWLVIDLMSCSDVTKDSVECLPDFNCNLKQI